MSVQFSDATYKKFAEVLTHYPTKRAAILEEAAAKFGPDGPSANRSTRFNQLQRLPEERTKIFADLYSRFYAAGEDFDVLLPLYAIDNKSHFTP